MKPAIVTATLRPRIKGDTVEFNTDKIRLYAHANVEELLNRIPGLQIDPEGNITFNGEKIQHLLVNGEDIFGNSPSLVTRNFDASKIGKIQILDRKTDQSNFTGVDDGNRIKTINLVIKDSENNGYFGKIETSHNSNGYYNSDGFVAEFKAKQQVTALGLASNTGNTKFSSSAAPGSSSVSIQKGIADPLGASAGTGIPQLTGTALHYANTWPTSNQHLVVNYQYIRYSTEPIASTQTIQTQPDSVYTENQLALSRNQLNQHWIDGTYNWTPTSHNALIMIFRANTGSGENQFTAISQGGYTKTPLNNSHRMIKDNVNQSTFNADLYWRSQIAKAGRNMTVGIGFNRIKNNADGFLYSLNTFYDSSGNLASLDTVDQRKQITIAPSTIKATITYTEPLWKSASLELNSTFTSDVDNPLVATYNHGDGKYTELIDSLSSRVHSRTNSKQASIVLQGYCRSLLYLIGTDWRDFNYHQRDLFSNILIHQNYSTINPRMIFVFPLNKLSNIRFFFTTATQLPSIAQLQPARNNSDPLHISLGNSNLKPTLTRTFRLDYMQVKTWRLSFVVTCNLISNDVSTRTTTDSLGRQISQSINVDGAKNGSINTSFGKQIQGINFDLHASGNFLQRYNYVNTDLSKNTSYSTGGGVIITQNIAARYSCQLTADFLYFHQRSSINTSLPISFWTQTHKATFTAYYFKNYIINTSALYTWQQKTSSFADNNSSLLWNGFIARNFFKDQLTIQAEVQNILNRNIGVSRTNSNNIYTQTSTNILGRYWMLSAAYHFDKKFKKKSQTSSY